MTDPTPEDHSGEQDTPDLIIELTSVEEDEPITLEEGDPNPEMWPKPPEDWDPDAHQDEYTDDPDVIIATDEQPDLPPAEVVHKETSI